MTRMCNARSLFLELCALLVLLPGGRAAVAWGPHPPRGDARALLALHDDLHGRGPGWPAARLPRETVVDNEAEATDERPQQYQDNADIAEPQEARHYSRRADEDNYEDEQDIVYDFSYEVKDPHTGNDFGHRQSRSGGLTQGQYRVLLPDGRMQVVDYVSDRDGFRPNIRYEDVGIPVFAGSENHEQFAEGSQQSPQAALPERGPQAAAADGPSQGPSPDELRRRRRRRRSAPSTSSAPSHRH